MQRRGYLAGGGGIEEGDVSARLGQVLNQPCSPHSSSDRRHNDVPASDQIEAATYQHCYCMLSSLETPYTSRVILSFSITRNASHLVVF